MTKPRNTPRGVECRACKAERERRGLPYPASPRPVKLSGLCHSHLVQRARIIKGGRL